MNTLEVFFNTSNYVMTHRPLSEYLKAFNIPRKKLYKLHGKKILLIGGGNSPIQHTFNRLGIDCDITNIDPYITNTRTARTNIRCDFTKTNFKNEFHEIWALYSLPLYSPSITHALQFYCNAVIALKPGGILRIGGHPRHNINAWFAAPMHFPCDKQSVQILDDMLRLIHELKIKQHKNHETYIAPKSQVIKDRLNKRLINLK